jgi:lysine 6-dehydrogenase
MSKKRVIVLGAGLVGAPMVFDLAADQDFEVAVADVNPDALSKFNDFKHIQIHQADLSDGKKVKNLVSDFDIVLSAVPGYMGFQTLRTIIEAGKNVIDIAFFPENLFDLDDLAKQNNVTAICDIGVAPGMSNILIGYVDHLLEKTNNAAIYVGGLPRERTWPFEYKAVFSPIDVIEEYTRPARFIRDGKMIVKPALTDPELLHFSKVGTLEAFNSDGLRSLADTINCPNMIEKTLRYKGHIEKMAMLRDTGFFNKEPVEVNGIMVSPLDLTTKLLFPKWKLLEGEEDITVMRVIIEGEKDNKKLRYTYELYDSYDPASGVHSMARTTGYTATMAVRMLAKGLYLHKGVSAPEFIGKNHRCVEFMLKGLADRGIIYQESIMEISN